MTSLTLRQCLEQKTIIMIIVPTILPYDITLFMTIHLVFFHVSILTQVKAFILINISICTNPTTGQEHWLSSICWHAVLAGIAVAAE